MDKIYTLRCTVCQTQTGQIVFPANSPVDTTTLTLADVGFEDVRCDEHPVT